MEYLIILIMALPLLILAWGLDDSSSKKDLGGYGWFD